MYISIRSWHLWWDFMWGVRWRLYVILLRSTCVHSGEKTLVLSVWCRKLGCRWRVGCSHHLCWVSWLERDEGSRCRVLDQLFCWSLNSGSRVTLTATEGLSSVAEHEDALLRHLFQGYQKWVRPVLNSSDIIKVYFGLKISQLVDVVSHPPSCVQNNTPSLTVVIPDICLSLSWHWHFTDRLRWAETCPKEPVKCPEEGMAGHSIVGLMGGRRTGELEEDWHQVGSRGEGKMKARVTARAQLAAVY